MDWQPLLAAATTARARAHAPYSRFAVGSAVLTASGAIHAGCNVENRSYGATVCAERVALGSALAAGERQLTAVLVLAEASPPAPPCGICLQCLAELAAPDLPVRLVNPGGETRDLRLAELLPHPFELPRG